MVKSVLVIVFIFGWCFWLYKNQTWVLTPVEAKIMYETGSGNLRLLNFGLIASAITLFYLKEKSAIAALILVLAPWWFRYGVFNRNFAWLMILNMLAYVFVQKKIMLVIVLSILNLYPIYKSNSWFWKDENLNLKNAKIQTLNRFESETQITKGNEILPVKIKKIAYNKFFYLTRNSFVKLAKVLDFELISSPSQQNVTVGNNPFSRKNLPLVLPLVLWLGLFGLAKTNYVLIFVAILSGFLGKTDDLLANTFLLAPAFSIAAAIVLQKLDKRVKLIIIILTLFMAKDLWYRFIYDELRWNDNKNRTMEMLANVAYTMPGKITASEMLGPTRWYYYYKYGQDSRITFKHFDLEKEQKEPDTTYIGLPGEFAGERGWAGRNDFDPREAKQDLKIIKTIPLFDTVSFGNGDEIWVGK